MSYLVPTSTAEALNLLSQSGAQIAAGCTDIYPARRQGHIPDRVLDITHIADLRGIARTPEGWRIGAAVTWTQIANAELPPAFDGLKQAALQVGAVQIQNRGTVAGNICNASPAADGVPPLLALDARVEIASRGGARVVALADFITGVRAVDLRADEMVTAILIPALPEHARGAFVKLGSRTHLVISIAMVAAVVDCAGDSIASARVAAGSCSPVAQRLPALEARLAGTPLARIAEVDFAAPALFEPLSPISDVRGSASYRLDVVAELCRRAVIRASKEG
ncbi:FAD binding domain-containing protein [Paracoccus sp. (in: a-proteobacteria)]|uniref:FAD binding domain-containing protein n=1 Tax=Paracoccus sp. TaxID=267 RepID=UPI003A845BAC